MPGKKPTPKPRPTPTPVPVPVPVPTPVPTPTPGEDGYMASWANAKDFGAIGDGQADDTAALVAALATGHNVVAPEGVYSLSSMVGVPAGQRLSGVGDKTVFKRRGGYSSSIILGVTGVLERCTVDGNWPAVSATMDLGLGSGAVLDTIRWQNGSYGVAELGGPARILNSTFIGAWNASAGPAWGFWFGVAGLKDIVFDKCVFRGLRVNALFGGADGLRIINCEFTGNHQQWDPTGGGQIDLVAGSRNVIIEGNYFGPAPGGASAMEIDTADGIVVTGNVIESQANIGIILQSAAVRQAVVANNVIRKCGGTAIVIASGVEDFVVVGNICRGNGSGIDIQSSGIGKVSDNIT